MIVNFSPFSAPVEEVVTNGFPQSNGSSPGATPNKIKNGVNGTANGVHFPSDQMPSGSSSIVNLEDTGDDVVSCSFFARSFSIFYHLRWLSDRTIAN